MTNNIQSVELPEDFNLFEAIASVATHYDENPPDENLLDIFASLALEDAQEQERLEKRMRRIGDCGKQSYRFDPHTGKRSGYVFNCGLFRECDRCRSIRCRIEGEMIKKACAMKELKYMILDREDIRRAIDRSDAKRDNYARFPQMDGTEIFVYDENITDYGMGEVADYKWAMSIDWLEAVNTPEGRNISGGAHRPEKVPETEKFAIIQTSSLISSAPSKKMIEIMDRIIEETGFLIPENPDEVQGALKERTMRTKKELENQGYQVRVYYKKEKLILSKISWGLIKDINTKKEGKIVISKMSRTPNFLPDFST